jgi:hypothetical protein
LLTVSPVIYFTLLPISSPRLLIYITINDFLGDFFKEKHLLYFTHYSLYSAFLHFFFLLSHSRYLYIACLKVVYNEKRGGSARWQSLVLNMGSGNRGLFDFNLSSSLSYFLFCQEQTIYYAIGMSIGKAHQTVRCASLF